MVDGSLAREQGCCWKSWRVTESLDYNPKCRLKALTLPSPTRAHDNAVVPKASTMLRSDPRHVLRSK